jgi:hypothetical protein
MSDSGQAAPFALWLPFRYCEAGFEGFLCPAATQRRTGFGKLPEFLSISCLIMSDFPTSVQLLNRVVTGLDGGYSVRKCPVLKNPIHCLLPLMNAIIIICLIS